MHHLLLKPKNLVIVRHAESLRNAGKQGVFYTEQERTTLGNVLNQDIPLTENGHSQAITRGKDLFNKYEHFDIVINSGYLRTIQTMEGIMSEFPKDLSHKVLTLQNIAIRERDSGWAYLMTQEEVSSHFPWNESVWDLGDHFYTRPMGGESLADVADRISVFFLQLAQISEGKNVLLVSHGRAITAMKSLLENWQHKHYQKLPKDVQNAEAVCYRFSKKKQSLVKLPK
jgi:broad specificity phosphatase PhoE